MTWAYYQAPDSHDIDDIFRALTKQINAIASGGTQSSNGYIAATAKIVDSDQRDGFARGVIFYSLDPLPLTAPSGKQWTSITFQTKIHYESELYQPTLAQLNRLTAEQAMNAHATMTNYKLGTATLTLWWPSSTS